MNNESIFTVTEAATYCAVSDETIRRRLKRGAFPGAWRDPGPTGAWHIPEEDLRTAGFDVQVAASAASQPSTLRMSGVSAAAAMVNELGRLTDLVAELLQHLHAAHEQHLGDLRKVAGLELEGDL